MTNKGNPPDTLRNPLPDPLQGGGWLGRLGTLAPPAVSLSFASATVAALVFGFLQRNADLRGLFKIAFTDNPSSDHDIRLGLGLFAALLAWAIVLRCRRRPGPLWPRGWALALALLTSGLAAIQGFSLWPGQTPLLDAATLASLAAALALWPRLLRLHPDNRLVQSIAPLSLSLVLSAVLPGLYFMGGDVVAVWKHGLNSAVGGLREQIQELRQCGETKPGCSKEEFRAALNTLEGVIGMPSWREAADQIKGNPALEQRYGDLLAAEGVLLETLAAELPRRLARQIRAVVENKPDLGVDSLADFKNLLPVATKLGRIDSIRKAYAGLADTLIQAPLPALDEPPVIYTSSLNENGPWEANSAFADASRVVIGQHQLMKNLLLELESAVDGEEPGLRPLKDDFRKKLYSDWRLRLQAMEGDWALHWVLPYLQDDPAPTGIPPIPLKAVLAFHVIGGLAASDLDGLLNLSRHEADKLYREHRASNCVKTQKEPIFRLDCRAYGSAAKDKTALRVELRVIYDTHKNADKPDRLYFLLPLPADASLDSFVLELENALPEARAALEKLQWAIELQKSLQQDGILEIPPQCPPPSGWACAEAWGFVKGSAQDYIKLVIYRH